jgi:hypothetical protein
MPASSSPGAEGRVVMDEGFRELEPDISDHPFEPGT